MIYAYTEESQEADQAVETEEMAGEAGMKAGTEEEVLEADLAQEEEEEMAEMKEEEDLVAQMTQEEREQDQTAETQTDRLVETEVAARMALAETTALFTRREPTVGVRPPLGKMYDYISFII